eukprot:1172535-Rhodomonas_salina.1
MSGTELAYRAMEWVRIVDRRPRREEARPVGQQGRAYPMCGTAIAYDPTLSSYPICATDQAYAPTVGAYVLRCTNAASGGGGTGMAYAAMLHV